MAGRYHLYEGRSWGRVVFPVRVMAALGVKMLIVTNAAGGINRRFSVGDVMRISDHIGLFLGPYGVRSWPAGSVSRRPYYSEFLAQKARQAARSLGIPLREGVLLSLPGPCYETQVELNMAHRIGADAVTMSTVPEVLTAREEHMAVLGLSRITNLAFGVGKKGLTHSKVLEEAAVGQETASALIAETLRLLDPSYRPCLSAT